MMEKEHRLFTRWFSRRVDLGALLTGCLFVLIWLLLPSGRVADVPMVSAQHMRVHVTDHALGDLPAYQRPDLLLRPSDYGFGPSRDTPGELPVVPSFTYSRDVGSIASTPVGMGTLPGLIPNIAWGESAIWYRSQARGVTRSGKGQARRPFDVRYSDGLGASSLNLESDLWQAVTGENAWEFSFWIAIVDEASDSRVFVESGSGDAERDLRLVRIVQRPDAWDIRVGRGVVWLRYQPTVGDEYAHQED